MKVVDETLHQLLQMVWCLGLKRIFVDEIFELKLNSSLITVNIRIGVKERGSLKILQSDAYPIYSKDVHSVKPPLTNSEFNMHMQNQL